MNCQLKRVGALAFAGMLAIAGCDGENGQPGTPGRDGTDGVPGLTSTGLNVEVTGVTVNADQTVSVRFTMKDSRGYPVDRNGVYSENAPFTPTFSLAYIAKDANGKVLPYVVLTKTRKNTTSSFAPGAFNPSTAGQGTLVDDAPGSYTYTFPAASTDLVQAATLDPTKLSSTHTIWIQAARQTDPDDRRTIAPVNYEYNFIPSGSGTPERREIASTAGCNKCHDGFRAYTVEGGFHGGGRVNAAYCGICHNSARPSGLDASGVPAAEAGRFVHRVHYGEHLALASSVFHGIDEVTYPQDIRNCKMCHEGAAQGDQWYTRPNRAACGSCHDYVSFVEAAGTKCNDATDKSAGCRHSGGPQSTDAACTTCHDGAAVQEYHVPVVAKDPNNSLDGGSNVRTNAAAIAAADALPAGASRLTAEVASVTVDPDGAGTLHPSIKFRILRDGAPVVFNAYAAGTEPITDFVGTIGLYFAWAEPQDGVDAPADFNKTASSNLRALWKSGALVDDGDGYYSATLTNVVAASAVMVTGGIGYQYDLPNATEVAADNLKNMPLTQTNVPGFPFDATKKSGGLIVPIPNVWKTATGYTARRAIVSADKCNACHAPLGTAPTFHVGQRNDGPTCSFCHNPNKAGSNSGWAANAKDFVHALHGAGKRTVPFAWHAVSATEGFWDVTYPGYLADCQQCHLPGTYDFSASQYTANDGALVDSLLFSVAASGTVVDNFAKSPYAPAGSYSGDAVLVTSPITAACIACHDSDAARYHMLGNGGTFYAPRSSVKDGAGNVINTEQCLVCHAKGKIAPIGEVHW